MASDPASSDAARGTGHTAQSQPAPQAFQHRQQPPVECDCPIHADRDREPFTAPLGLSFAGGVDVVAIDRETAGAIYAAHHSYMADVPQVNLAHHGLRYQEHLVGAITWRYPLLRKLSFRGETYDGDEVVEAARICVGVRMPNLASAALARSQERFVAEHAADRGVRLLTTYVRADYDGSMIRALADKGWTRDGTTTPGQAGNRPDKAIRDHAKWRFRCPVATVRRQTRLDRWADAAPTPAG